MKHIKKITLAAALPLMMFASVANNKKVEEKTIATEEIVTKMATVNMDEEKETGTFSDGLGMNFIVDFEMRK